MPQNNLLSRQFDVEKIVLTSKEGDTISLQSKDMIATFLSGGVDPKKTAEQNKKIAELQRLVLATEKIQNKSSNLQLEVCQIIALRQMREDIHTIIKSLTK